MLSIRTSVTKLKAGGLALLATAALASGCKDEQGATEDTSSPVTSTSTSNSTSTSTTPSTSASTSTGGASTTTSGQSSPTRSTAGGSGFTEPKPTENSTG